MLRSHAMTTQVELSKTSVRSPQQAASIVTRAEGSHVRRSLVFWATGALVPAAAAVAAGLPTRSKLRAAIAGGIGAVAVALVRSQLERQFVDEPAYDVEQRLGELEIRTYAPRVEARTELKVADFDHARSEGFQRLAGYIGGANWKREKLPMTTPVTVRRAGESHVAAFVMEPGRTRDALPEPYDERIQHVAVPAQRVAVLRFRGRYNAKTVAAAAERLAELLAKYGLTAKTVPYFAGFDPPWVLGLFRRNEVWVELA